MSGYPSSHWSSRTFTPSPSPIKASRSLTIGMGFLPKIWDALREGSPAKRCRRRPGIPSWRDTSMELEYHSDGSIDYTNMTPLDGEEGELIDDEACVIDVRAVTGLGKFLTLRILDCLWATILVSSSVCPSKRCGTRKASIPARTFCRLTRSDNPIPSMLHPLAIPLSIH